MRYLTKSRFTTAITCPTKLKFLDDGHYANANATNEFLLALADGGHQIGALAKCLFPEGIEVNAEGHDAQVEQTARLLENENIVIFEAAFRVRNLFIRVDLLRKAGRVLELYEVKSKSYNSDVGLDQIVKKTGISSEFKPYIYDVAFQRYVLRNALPDFDVKSYLVMPDKARLCAEDDVAQRLVVKRGSRRSVEVDVHESLRDGRTARHLLFALPTDDLIDRLTAEELQAGGYTWPFEEGIAALEASVNGNYFEPRASNQCKSCEFRSTGDETKLDGRRECWSIQFNADPNELEAGTVFDLSNFRSTDALLRKGMIRLPEIEPEDISVKEEKDKLTSSKRQWLQCEESRGAVREPHFLKAPLQSKLGALSYPIHFIDFETATPSLPYHANLHPYETILFQFSHHQMNQDGRVFHASQHLESTPSKFPNFEVVRNLRQSIGQDSGSVVHWWTHERTVLTKVREQLQRWPEPLPDRDELVSFIDGLMDRLVDLGQHITHPLVFFPGTKGSSSIKKVLPAVLNWSHTLQDRYGAATYGTEAGITSLNFSGKSWVIFEGGRILDPYKLLTPRFNDPELDDIERFEEGDAVVDNGGAAMVAYALLQSLPEGGARASLELQLLRYCELDTLAMVMAYEGMREMACA